MVDMFTRKNMKQVFINPCYHFLLCFLLLMTGCGMVLLKDDIRRYRDVERAANQQDVDFLINALLHDKSDLVRVMAAHELGLQRTNLQKIIPALIEALCVDISSPIRNQALGSLNILLNYGLSIEPNNNLFKGLQYILTQNDINNPIQRTAANLIIHDIYNYNYWFEYGRTALLSNDNYGALVAFNAAIQLNKKCLPAYKHLGLLLVSCKRYKKAKEIYEMVLYEQKDSELLSAYGYCLFDLGKDNQALEAFKESIKTNSDPISVASARLGASAILKRQGDEVAAEHEFEEATKINREIGRILDKQKSK